MIVLNKLVRVISYYQKGMKNGKEIVFCKENQSAIEYIVEFEIDKLKNDIYLQYSCDISSP